MSPFPIRAILYPQAKLILLSLQYRVWAAIARNYLPPLRPRAVHPSMLFHHAITTTHASLPECDYNLHKSNSTYFSDLDVSRSQLVTHLLRPGLAAVADNARTRCVANRDGDVVRGGLGIGLGAVFCAFRREVAPWQAYELWTRVLAWDRKWVYLVTHFVVQGKVRPTAWDDGRGGGGASAWFGPLRQKKDKTETAALGEGEGEGFEKYVIATAVSKYVFKVGRFTVHPTILMEQSGLLPERPGGWRSGPNEVGDEEADLGDVEVGEDEQWDWKRVEHQRREGMKYAAKFAALDGLNQLFDGGEDGALGRFYPG